jgi:hypothetical protein
MMAAIGFLKTGRVNAIEEVVALMTLDFEAYGDLPQTIAHLAESLPATLASAPWRTVTGSSGGLYPLYVSETEPFVVYAAIRRNPEPDEVFVLHVGLRGNRRPAVFYQDLETEIDRRIALPGWLP